MKEPYYKIKKKYISKFGINGALLLTDLESRRNQFADSEMLNKGGEFFVALQDIHSSTKLSLNTIKRLIPTLNSVIKCEIRNDRLTTYTKEQVTYYFKFLAQGPNGLANDKKGSSSNSPYEGNIDEKIDDKGYEFLLNPITTENIKQLVKLMNTGWLPNHISENHMLGKIHTIYQIEAVYNIFYLK
jgi:hypothetical protein